MKFSINGGGCKRILFLGYAQNRLIDFLVDDGFCVYQSDEKLVFSEIESLKFSYLVSYGYRFMIKPEILSLFDKSAVNLHISLLPFNRGSDPNFWSFVDDTPKGVSVHFLDATLDTGDIIAQKELEFEPKNESFSSTYAVLKDEIELLFMKIWSEIRDFKTTPKPQTGFGSYHKTADKEPYLGLLTSGWDTNIDEFLKNIKS
ncbi:formyltransferase family protein [Campylobacter mucosalis]|uniref:formyltransferase family protein n=1 Tax=Campylobacter mucosalis TaxID=202 RepID=UPI00147066AC|nr:formyltransferase family protein [Campylobacter mucosalis]QKF62224.1 formyltransferase domain-containing protein [Campylobacter mucosalis]